MTWRPNPRVLIGGRDYTSQTVGRVSFNRGRPDIDSTPSAGSAQVTLRDIDPGALNVTVGERLELFVDDSSGQPVQVFGGQIQEVGLSTVSQGGGEAVVVWQVSASGPLSRLNRRTVLFTGRPSEDDGERVAAAVAAGLAQAWEETGGTWAEQDVSWELFDPGYDAALIDPGVYTLAALATADAGYNPASVVQDAGFSARGVVYETRDGFIAYADANRRVAAATAVALEVPTSVLEQSGLGFRQLLTSLVNKVTVEYDGGAFTASDADSILTFGVWQTELRTQLADASAGSALATEFVRDRAYPAYELDEVSLLLNNAGTALRDALLGVEPNDPVRLTGMPSGLPVDSLVGFVESVAMSVDDYTAQLVIGVSDAALSVGSTRWNSVGTAVTWASIGSAVAWVDARSL